MLKDEQIKQSLLNKENLLADLNYLIYLVEQDIEGDKEALR